MKLLNLIPEKLRKRISPKDLRLGSVYFFLCTLVVLFQLGYLNLRYGQLAVQVPLLYTRSWGEAQLASKELLFMIPAISLGISLIGLFFFFYMSIKYYKYGPGLIFFSVLFSHVFLTYSLLRIMGLSLLIEVPLISREAFLYVLAFLVPLVVVLFVAPSYVLLMEKWRIVTDPAKHAHPGMLLAKPSARGGGLLFAFLFVCFGVLWVPLTTEVLGILGLTFLVALLGLADDYQNTHTGTRLDFLENPLIRLGILFFIVSSLYFFDISIGSLMNPFDGMFNLAGLSFTVAELVLNPLSWLVTTVWVTWILNLLSWSNGVDGQYSGIVGVALIIVSLLGLRFNSVGSAYSNYVSLGLIAAGISLGILSVSWHPSRMMWGFGAMSVGFVLAVLSILVQAKVITSILILLFPFLDALVTFVRRLLAGKSPWKGDREHLHHLLIENGYSVRQIAVFYWIITALFGGLSFLSVNNDLLQGILMIAGVLFFFLILVSLKLSSKPQTSPEAE